MKNKYLIFFTILIFCLELTAQNNFYYYKNQKIYLNIDKSNLNLSLTEQFQKSDITNLDLVEYSINSEKVILNHATSKYSKIQFTNLPSDIIYFQNLNYLKNISTIETVNPSFITLDGQKIGMSNYFYVKLKNSSNLANLQSLVASKSVIIVKQDATLPLWYTLKCTKNTIGNTLEIANLFFESGYFESSSTDFLLTANDDLLISNATTVSNTSIATNCANDIDFSQQWGLNNGYTDGVLPLQNNFNYDINACEAWTLSQGANVKVAVVDSGVDLNNLDFINNLFPLSYDLDTNTSPSQILSGYPPHGTHVAGIIGASRNNDYQISGVAPQSKIISVSNKLQRTAPNHISSLVDGINWAVQNGADIINNSWQCLQSAYIYDAIDNAITNGRSGLGAIMVFCSGNNPTLTPAGFSVWYPANSNPKIITVGALTSVGQRSSFSKYGNSLDMVAPGSFVLTTTLNNGLLYADGTSFAAPHVSGVAALILSVNPCLSGQQVNDIIEKTCQKVGGYSYVTTSGRPNGTWNNEMGYGLVDAHEAVQLALAMNSSTLDLMVKDTNDDFGVEPNMTNSLIWNSPDIWVRNQDDGIQIQKHQNPKYYSNGNSNYLYVRVTNKSCVASTGNELLKLYFAQNKFWLNWPTSWNTILPVGQITIPVLQAGSETILTIPWTVPNPTSFPSNQLTANGNSSFSLLARIESGIDTMTYPETGTVTGVTLNAKLRFYANVKNNNNIAWKNSILIDVASGYKEFVTLENLSDQIQNSYLEIVKEISETGKSIYDEAEISLKMDETLFNAWERGGKLAQNLEATSLETKKIVSDNNVILDNISLNPNDLATLQIDFNFLTQELTDKNTYKYHIIQKDKATGQIIGGETFLIKKDVRPIFIANAGDTKNVDQGEPIIISASQISESAIYNWYDTNGNLVFTGKDLSIAASVATKYKLEVIASADGFKDYDEVEVKLKPSTIESISPNPSSNTISISYKINGFSSAYLMILGGYGTTATSNNYIIDTNATQRSIDISNYQNGFYTVALICNGAIIDAKTLIKN